MSQETKQEVLAKWWRHYPRAGNAASYAVMAFITSLALPGIATNNLAAAELRKGAKAVNYGRPFEPRKLRVLARSFDWKPVMRESLPAARTASKGTVTAFQIAKVRTLLPAEPITGGGAPGKITLIPYGCTKFRISMFPITEHACKAYVSEKPQTRDLDLYREESTPATVR